MKKNKKIILFFVSIFVFNIAIISYGLNQLKIKSYEIEVEKEYSYNLVVVDKKDIIKDKIEETFEQKTSDVIETFIGTMTGYGPDCFGCSGVTASGYDIRNGNIFYEDKTFGTLRILAADKSIPFGTVIRVSGIKIYDKPFLGIVLDTGGLIKGTLLDLAFSSEKDEEVAKIGRSQNVKYEILRKGF